MVVLNTPNNAPMLFVNVKWSEPSGSVVMSAKVGGTNTGVLTLTTVPVLGIPFTNAVSNA